VSSHGMLAILEVLEGKCSRDVLMKLLHIINLVSRSISSTDSKLTSLASWSRAILGS
jgi:hypothetical protein